MLGIGAKAAGIPLSTNLVSLAAHLAPTILGPLAAIAGLAGLPLAFVGLVHSIASNISGTTASTINALMSNPALSFEEVQEQLATLGTLGAFPMTGGPQPIGNLPFDAPLTGPQGAQFNIGQGRSLSQIVADFTARTEVAPPEIGRAHV